MIEQGIDCYGAEYKRTSNDFHFRKLLQDNCVCSICHGTGANIEFEYVTRNYESARKKGKICKTLQAHGHSFWICNICLTNLNEKARKITDFIKTEQETAEWIKGANAGFYICSKCEYVEDGKPNYCAGCGAKMEGSIVFSTDNVPRDLTEEEIAEVKKKAEELRAEKQTNTAECVDVNVKKEMEYLTAYNEGWNDCCEHYGKGDLIHRETARRIIDSPRNKEQMLMMLASIPAVKNMANWVGIDDDPQEDFECTHCGRKVYGITPGYVYKEFPYCPGCGSEMMEVEE